MSSPTTIQITGPHQLKIALLVRVVLASCKAQSEAQYNTQSTVFDVEVSPEAANNIETLRGLITSIREGKS